jgi:hypothetical protein
MTPEAAQRLFLGLLLAVHDGDEAGFAALLNGLPRAQLRVVLRSMVEAVVGGHLAIEEWPGATRDRLAREALTAAGR